MLWLNQRKLILEFTDYKPQHRKALMSQLCSVTQLSAVVPKKHNLIKRKGAGSVCVHRLSGPTVAVRIKHVNAQRRAQIFIWRRVCTAQTITVQNYSIL